MKPFPFSLFLSRKTPVAAIIVAFGFHSNTAFAATINKADNTNDLNLTTSWTGSVVPTASDIANWSGLAGANSALLGGNLGFQGISIGTTGGAVTIQTGNTLTLGTSGINLGGASQDLTISSNLALTTGNQVWNVASGRFLTLNTGTFSREAGATVNLQGLGTVAASMTGLANTNSIVGPWATVGSGLAARYATLASGNLSAFTTATAVAAFGWTSANNNTFNYDVAATQGNLGAGRQANTARYTGAVGTQNWGNNATITVTLNGLMNAGTGTLTFAQAGGTSLGLFGIGTNNNNELILDAANADIAINIPVINTGANVGSVVVAGPNLVSFGATNTFTGNLTINGRLNAGNGQGTTPTASNLGALQPAANRNIIVNSGGILSLTGGNVLGTGASTNTLSNTTLIVNPGGLFRTGLDGAGSGWWNKIGATNLIGGTIRVGSGANTTNFQGLALIGTVTVGGSSPSSIENFAASNSASNSVHLGQNAAAAQSVTFDVADVTSSAASDLNVSTKLINTSANLTASGFTKTGAGTMTLSATNSFTGATVISGGVLQIGDGTTDGAITASSSIANDASLVYNIGGTQAFPNPLTGAGTLTKNGIGQITFSSGSNNLSGSTLINDGTLLINGNFGSIAVADNNLATIGQAPGAAPTAASLSFAGDGRISATLNGGPAPITVTGALTTTPANGQVTLAISSPLLTTGIHDIISFGSFSGAASHFTANILSGLNSRQSASVILNGSNVALQVVGDSPKWTGLDSGSWTTASTGASSNWQLITGGTPTNYTELDNVLFDDTATGSTTVLISSADVSPLSTTFQNSSKNYILDTTGFGILTGSLQKSGTGSLTIRSNNLLPGGFTFSGGILNLDSTTALGNGTFTIGTGSTKTLDNTSGFAVVNSNANSQSWLDDFTFTGTSDLDLGSGTVTIAGDGNERAVTVNAGALTVGEIKAPAHGLTKLGAGTLVVTSTGAGAAASTSAGTLNVSEGTLQINRTGSDSPGSGDFTAAGLIGTGNITNGAAVERWIFINTLENQTFSGTLSNGGTGALGFVKQGAGNITLSGNNSHTAQTTIEAGTLTMGHPSAFGIGTTIRMAGNNVATLDISTDGGNNLYGFVFSSGVNSTILSNRATEGAGLNHTLTTIGANGIGGGTLTVASGFNVTSGAGRITFDNFGLSAGAAALTTLVNPTSANVTIGNVSKVANTTAQTLGLGGTSDDNTVTGLIANGNAIISVAKSNSSTWTISGANNTYTGNTTIGSVNGAGILRATASGALGTGTIVFDGSGGTPGPSSRLELSNDIVLANAIDLNQRNNPSAAILNTSGGNTLSGNINLTVGGIQGNIESEAGLLTLSGTISTNTLITRNLHLGGAGNGAVTGPIVNNAVDPAGIVTVNKNGDGTWTLSGDNTYTGATSVNAGTLSITQPALADSAPVNISSSAVLNLSHASTDVIDRLFIGGIEQAPGTWGSLASSAPNKTARITGTGILSVSNGVSGYGSWASSLGLTQGVNDASTFDAENDGFDNGTEYMLGGHPLNGSNNPKTYSLLADSSADLDGDRELIMTIAVPQGTPTFSAGAPTSSASFEGYTVTVRGSTNLTSFPVTITPVDPVITGLPPAPVQGGITYEYRSFSLDGSNGTLGKGFIQVTVQHP